MARFDDELWPLARFVVDPADVLTHYAQRQQLDAAEERHHDYHSRISDREGDTAEFQPQVNDRDHESEDREHQPEERDQLQRVAREADYAVDTDCKRAKDLVVLACPANAGVAVEATLVWEKPTNPTRPRRKP